LRFRHHTDKEARMVREMVWLITITAAMCTIPVAADARTSSPLELAETIVLADVRGRIDHLAVDRDEARLFVAALGNDSVEVVDLRAGTRVARITGLHEPQGIGYVRGADRLYVANAGGGVDVFEASTLQRLSRIEGLDDADNVRVDAADGKVYVGYRHALAAVDAKGGELLESIELAGHPESFQLEPAGTRIFVNVPSAAQIAIVDRRKKLVIGHWNLGERRANFPMALDEANHRLFVATRKPASLLIFDTEGGTRTTELTIAGDADDLFYDAKRKRLYVICGDGVIDIVQQKDADHYERAGEIRTVRGARTGLFVPSRDALLVAVPVHAGDQAEIRVFTAR
jgi:DNA-binding beta-propeller fold protein YncE